jgi:hypothetical protein
MHGSCISPVDRRRSSNESVQLRYPPIQLNLTAEPCTERQPDELVSGGGSAHGNAKFNSYWTLVKILPAGAVREHSRDPCTLWQAIMAGSACPPLVKAVFMSMIGSSSGWLDQEAQNGL